MAKTVKLTEKEFNAIVDGFASRGTIVYLTDKKGQYLGPAANMKARYAVTQRFDNASRSLYVESVLDLKTNKRSYRLLRSTKAA